MTWARFRPELVTEAARDQLTDAEFRLYMEASLWLFATEDDGLHIPRHMLRMISTVDTPEDAAAGLVKRGWWKRAGEDWEIVHDGNVIRQGLAAQWAKRERDLKAQHKRRGKEPGVSASVSGGVSADISTDLTNYLTTKKPAGITELQARSNPSTNGEAVICEECRERAVSAALWAETRYKFGRVLCSACYPDAFVPHLAPTGTG